MMSAAGTAVSASACTTSTSRGWSSASRFSDSSIATPTMIAIFANSAGCSEKPAGSWIHALVPLTREPTTSTATSPSTEAPYRNGTYARSSR